MTRKVSFKATDENGNVTPTRTGPKAFDEPVIHSRFFRYNGNIQKIYQYIDRKRDPSKFYIPKWCLGILFGSLFLIMLILAAALAVVYFAPRQALHQENCQKRSCISGFNLKCISGICQCDANHIYIKKCEPKRNYLESCHKTNYCKDNANLVCLDGLCKCNETKYWNETSCVDKGTLNATCSSDDHCLTNKMLYCNKSTGKCDCATTRYWDANGKVCYPKQSYTEKCAITGHCQEWRNLVCSASQCSCTADYYWEPATTVCQYRHVENRTCTGTYQCFSPMTCTGSRCRCGNFEYHDLASLTCIPQSSYGESCAIEYNCRVDKYLECQNGTCQCITAYPHWSVGFDACIVPVTYNAFCHDTTDCNTTVGLFCKTATDNCTCPTNVATSNCDCTRVLNNEQYWSGTACVTARSYGQSCNNAASTYMCKTITQGTVCRGPSPFTCKCLSSQFYNTITKKCQTLLTHGNPCYQADACKSSLGLSCIGAFCACNTTTQFWDGTKCIDYYTYNTETCTGSGQCDASLGLVCRLDASTCNCPSSVSNKCDCITRSASFEYYWDGTKCVRARYYNQACTATYMCMTVTEKTVCDATGKCTCGTTGVWDPVNEYCKTCDPGWVSIRTSCFRPSTGDSDYFQQSMCYGKAGFLARLYPSEIPIFGGYDDHYVNTLYIAGSPCVRIKSGGTESHGCHDRHPFICEYVL